jgi:N-acetylglucosaminyldiphosphoundecaprenol N-acetyl-beta-D-mannosaminyltransferase
VSDVGCGRRGAWVIGSHIEAVGWAECLARIGEWATMRSSRYVCLCNVHSLVTARRDPAFRRIIGRADLAAPDGAPVAWCLRRLGYPGQPRISGPDLMWRCCARAAALRLPVFLYGGYPATLARLAARLKSEFPGLEIAGCEAPPFRLPTAGEDAATVRAIARSGARIVFVALGCPRQEAWMAAHRGSVPAVMMGVGAAFDFHAGSLRRAPRWMQRAGLEWLHRLAAEPRRLWRRYLVTNTLFAAYLLGERLTAGRKKGQTRSGAGPAP